jgi:hypothetical protein
LIDNQSGASPTSQEFWLRELQNPVERCNARPIQDPFKFSVLAIFYNDLLDESESGFVLHE